MDLLLTTIYTSLPFLFVLLLALLALAGVGVGMVAPRLLAYPYLAIFFWINSMSYGSLAPYATPGVYSRGSGLLYFALVQWYMLGAWCCARVAASFQRFAAPPCNLRPWFLGWALLLAAHAAFAVFSGIRLADALAPSGFSNIVWMAPLVSLLLLSFRTGAQVAELTRFILLAGLGRALFGLARWAAFGGDPNNVYANMNAIKIRLTFFDINDSTLCMIAFAIAAVQLFQGARSGGARFWRGVEWLALFACALSIVLSYRRTAWFGFLLGGAVVLLRLPLRRRLQVALAGLPLVGAALALAVVRRLSQTRGAGGGVGSLFYDMQSRRFGPESERVLELKLALADFLAHPLTGIGAWGRYTGYQRIAWQDNPDGGLFLHSGVLHIALKSGVPGLVLLAGTVCAFVAFARRALRALPPEYLGLGTAGVAALAFVIPDVLVGTPVPQVRTSQMIGFALALPYLAMAAAAPAPVRADAAPRRVNLVPA